ncbi:NAD(P)H-hydrate dehydratase [Sphingobium sp. AN558]|uniref:NAD(P)H-hydrate dehydratase n=1 Tax=Sphingobium sp. AN558 TaxID=3133442 RepID=UPI0030BCD9F9
MVALDAAWRAANPLPPVAEGADKNGRGRVLLVGGARFVPGALALTGEAVLRTGAGKLQMATVEAVALALGVLVPEAAMIALPMRDDGEIAPEAIAKLQDRIPRCDLLLVGPGMSPTAETGELVTGLMALSPPALLLDAAALTCVGLDELAEASTRMPLILTPNGDEMARLAGCSADTVAEDPCAVVIDIAQRTGAIIALKGPETWIAAPDGTLLHYTGGCQGLGTGGSGDVLAGLIGGLVARGAFPFVAAGWGVNVHGEAGSLASRNIGSLGFLARELLPMVPRLLDTL